MKMLVCVKQVPDMESRFKINPNGTWVDEKDLAFRMNEYDEFAVEQAVQIKEQLGGQADITVLTIGPARAAEVIKKALAMGADRGVHVSDAAACDKDPWQIASMIAAFTREKKFDLLFTGMQSQDRGSGQVGVLAAELLGVACVTTAIGFALNGIEATAVRELEGGVKMNVTFTLPGVVTCQLGLNRPRYPTLPNIMKARQKEVLVLPVADLPCGERVCGTEKMYRPERKTSGLVLEGDPNEMADTLVQILRDKISR
jgi:electron transfer flavoprotein beta subunit